MFKMKTDVDSMQLLVKKVFKMYEKHVKAGFQIFLGIKLAKKSAIGKIEVDLLTA